MRYGAFGYARLDLRGAGFLHFLEEWYCCRALLIYNSVCACVE